MVSKSAGCSTVSDSAINSVRAVNFSPDATRIVSGLWDLNLCVWSRWTDRQLLGPFKHDFDVAAVKFSPDGHFIAIATYERESHPWVAQPPFHRSFGSMTVSMVVSSLTAQSKTARPSISSSPGSTTASNCLRCRMMARSTVSVCPLGGYSLRGPFTVAGVLVVSPWQAMRRSSQPPRIHRSRSGTPLHTSKLALSITV